MWTATWGQSAHIQTDTPTHPRGQLEGTREPRHMGTQGVTPAEGQLPRGSPGMTHTQRAGGGPCPCSHSPAACAPSVCLREVGQAVQGAGDGGGGSAPRGSRDTRQHSARGAGCRRHGSLRVTGPAGCVAPVGGCVWPHTLREVSVCPPRSTLHASLPCHPPLPSIFQEQQAVTWNGSGPSTAARPRSPKIRPFLINNFPPFGSCWGFFPLRMGGDPLLHPAAPTRRLFPTVLEASPGDKGGTGAPRSRDPLGRRGGLRVGAGSEPGGAGGRGAGGARRWPWGHRGHGDSWRPRGARGSHGTGGAAGAGVPAGRGGAARRGRRQRAARPGGCPDDPAPAPGCPSPPPHCHRRRCHLPSPRLRRHRPRGRRRSRGGGGGAGRCRGGAGGWRTVPGSWRRVCGGTRPRAGAHGSRRPRGWR